MSPTLDASRFSRRVDERLGHFSAQIPIYRSMHVDFEKLPRFASCSHYTDLAGLTGICERRTLMATNPLEYSQGEEFVYYCCMAITAVRNCADLTDSEKARAERWIRRVLLERPPARLFVISFCLLPDSLSHWRTYAPIDGVSLSFNIHGLKALVNEKDSFIGRVYYSHPVQEAKILDKVKRTLASIGDSSPDGGNGAEILDRKLRMPLTKLIGFLKHPFLAEENEFRLVSISRSIEVERHPLHGQYAKFPLAPYLAKTRSRIFEAVQFGPSVKAFSERCAAVQQVLQRHGLTCGEWRRSDVPLQAS